MHSASNPAAAFRSHDHEDCLGSVLTRADMLSREAGIRMTPVRRRTLEILLEEHRALGAYEVLERLAKHGFGSQPPVAYRALEFLVEHGFAHKIRRLNAFAACMQPGEAHAPAFFICDACGAVAEVPEEDVRDALEVAADRLGFRMSRVNVEVLGTCPACIAEAA